MKSLREHITDAEARQVALGHFNISNTEQFHAILDAAKSLDLPIIIGTSEGERAFVGVAQAVALVRSVRENEGYPVFLNADHTYSLEKIYEAVDAGYDMVIFDGSKLSFEENVKQTKMAVEYAKSKNPDILVEGEIGYIGTSSKLLDELPEGVSVDEETLTKPDELAAFVKETGVDLVAPAVGNLHGMMKEGRNPAIYPELVKKLREAGGVSMVLHGGSGLSDEDFVNAIAAGMSIVHINTQIRIAFRKGLEEALAADADEIAPYRYMKPAVEAVQKVVEERLRLFSGQSAS